MGWGDYLNVFQMSSDLMFGLKIVGLVMLYGYMHMNLGGGLLSTAIFAIFAYYLLFYAQGILVIILLVLFFLMIHGFDIIWGGDIVKSNLAQGMAGAEMAAHHPRHARPPPI